MKTTTVECNASGLKMEITEEILAEYRQNGWDTPEDWGKEIDEVTWVNGDYHNKIEDSTWPTHLPYWESAD